MASKTMDQLFEVYDVIGTGAFANVRRVRRKEDGRLLVLKTLRACVGGLTAEERREMINEVDLLSELNHPNVIQYFGSFVEGGKQHIVMEYAAGGALVKVLSQARGPLPEDQIWEWFSQTCIALRYVHSCNILHRDIKPQNILLWGPTGRVVKLADFGIAKVLSSSTAAGAQLVGTPYYLAPEICSGAAYTQKSDVWALGCVLYEMVALSKPFQSPNLPQLALQIIREPHQPLHRIAAKPYSDAIRDLVDLLLQKDPDDRPDMTQLCAIPVVRHKMQLWGAIRDTLIHTEATEVQDEADAYILSKRESLHADYASAIHDTLSPSAPTPMPTSGPTLSSVSSPVPPLAPVPMSTTGVSVADADAKVGMPAPARSNVRPKPSVSSIDTSAAHETLLTPAHASPTNSSRSGSPRRKPRLAQKMSVLEHNAVFRRSSGGASVSLGDSLSPRSHVDADGGTVSGKSFFSTGSPRPGLAPGQLGTLNLGGSFSRFRASTARASGSSESRDSGMSFTSMSDSEARILMSLFIRDGVRVFRWGNGQRRPKLDERLYNASMQHSDWVNVDWIAASRFDDADAEAHHMLVLTEDGQVLSFGANDAGQLGIGATASSVPSLRQLRLIRYFADRSICIASVACGSSFSAAVSRDGKVYIWGDLSEVGDPEDFDLKFEACGDLRQSSAFVEGMSETSSSSSRSSNGDSDEETAFNPRGTGLTFAPEPAPGMRFGFRDSVSSNVQSDDNDDSWGPAGNEERASRAPSLSTLGTSFSSYSQVGTFTAAAADVAGTSRAIEATRPSLRLDTDFSGENEIKNGEADGCAGNADQEGTAHLQGEAEDDLETPPAAWPEWARQQYFQEWSSPSASRGGENPFRSPRHGEASPISIFTASLSTLSTSTVSASTSAAGSSASSMRTTAKHNPFAGGDFANVAEQEDFHIAEGNENEEEEEKDAEEEDLEPRSAPSGLVRNLTQSLRGMGGHKGSRTRLASAPTVAGASDRWRTLFKPSSVKSLLSKSSRTLLRRRSTSSSTPSVESSTGVNSGDKIYGAPEPDLEEESEGADPPRVGKRVHLLTKRWADCGVIRFMGRTDFAKGIWVGIELDAPEGKNDGAVKDTRYFKCAPGHGIFVQPHSVIVVTSGATPHWDLIEADRERRKARSQEIAQNSKSAARERDIAHENAYVVSVPSLSSDSDGNHSLSGGGSLSDGTSNRVLATLSLSSAEEVVVRRTCSGDDAHYRVESHVGTPDGIVSEPRWVYGLATSFAIEVACGGNFVCVLTREGRLYTWGRNEYGQLGHGHDDDQSRPTMVRLGGGDEGFIEEVVKSVAVGEAHVLAVAGSNTLYAWGRGCEGQLGLDREIYDEANPDPCLVEEFPGKVLSVAAGRYHSVGVTDDGEVYTWGEGERGQLGLGDLDSRRVPTLVENLGRNGVDVKVVHVSCGAAHTVALTETRAVYVWGDDQRGAVAKTSPHCVDALSGSSVRDLCCSSYETFALCRLENPQDGL